MKRLVGVYIAALLLACNGAVSGSPNVIERQLPGQGGSDEPVAMVTDDTLQDGGALDYDAGVCCSVSFALSVNDREVEADLVVGLNQTHIALVRQGDRWSADVCMPLVDQYYFYETRSTVDTPESDGGLFVWFRVNGHVSSEAGGAIPLLNFFDAQSAAECLALDAGVHGMITGEGVADAGTGETDGGSVMSDAGGGDSDAGISSPPDAGGTSTDAGTTWVARQISGDCDTLTSPTVLLSSVDGAPIIDELASSVTPLPFAFTFFGEPMTHFAAVTNGYLQVSPNASLMPTVESNPVEMPWSAAPNGVIAPLWCDLTQPPMGNASLSTQVFGLTPNRHFTTEWKNLTFFLGEQNNRVTFQAKLFEGTNAIEFHYCTLDANGEMTQFEQGQGAVVGIEGSDGGVSVEYSAFEAVLRTDAGIRFE